MVVHFGTPQVYFFKKVQKRAARLVTGNYVYETGGMTVILEQLMWESLKKKGGEIQVGVRATGRHYRQMRRKHIFGTKYYLATTSGKKKFSSKKIGT